MFLKVGWMGLATWRKQHQIWVEFLWVSLWNLNWHLCFFLAETGYRDATSWCIQEYLFFIFLFLCSFRPSLQDVSNFDGFNVTLLDPKGKGRCSRALPHVQCGSGRKLTVFVQTMMCSHVFLTTTPWLELGRSLNITIHSRDTWAEPTQMVVVWVHKEVGSPDCIPVWESPLCQPMEWDQDFSPKTGFAPKKHPSTEKEKYLANVAPRATAVQPWRWPFQRVLQVVDSQKTTVRLVRCKGILYGKDWSERRMRNLL